VTRAYILTKGAEADLHDITHYTVAQWGVAQCRTYIAALEEKAELVARWQGVKARLNIRGSNSSIL
jgi:toxin ParE1/3/4